MRRIVVTMLLCLGAVPASWGETLTLDVDGAVQRALESDPRIRERQHLVDAARAVLQEAVGSDRLLFDVNGFLGLAPGVDGGFFEQGADCGMTPCRVRDDAYDLDEGVSPWASVQFKIIKPLYTFGKIEHYAEAAQGQVDVKRGDVRLRRGQTVLEVKRAYYGYLAARDTRYLLQDVESRARKALDLVRRWLDEDSGDVKRSDLYALQSGVAQIKRYRAQAQAVEEVAREGLKLLTGLEAADTLEVADQRLTPAPLPERALDELQAQALEQRPEMAQLEAGLRARRSLVQARRAEKLPNVYAGVVGSLSYSPNRDRLDNPYVYDPFNHAGATPVVGIKWDWASGVQPAKVAQAQAELEALIDKSAFARRGIPFEVAEQYYQVRGHHEAVQELEEASRAARRWMVAAYADFEAGLEDSSRVLEAFKGYVLAHSDYLSTANDYNMHVARLRYVTGAEL